MQKRLRKAIWGPYRSLAMTLLAQWRRTDAPNLSQNAFDTLLKIFNRIVREDTFKADDLPSSFHDIDKYEKDLDLIVCFSLVIMLNYKLNASVRPSTKSLFLVVLFISTIFSNASNSFWRVTWHRRCFRVTAPHDTAERTFGMVTLGKNNKQEFARITLVHYILIIIFASFFFLLISVD